MRAQELRRRYMLTERETEIFMLLAEGRTNSEISQSLHIALGTTKTHVYNIYRKLGISSRAELAELAAPVVQRRFLRRAAETGAGGQ